MGVCFLSIYLRGIFRVSSGCFCYDVGGGCLVVKREKYG